MKSLLLKSISLLFMQFFILFCTPLANAETLSDRVSSKIPDAGPGGYIRLLFDPNIDGDNYSIQPNAKHDSFKSVLPVCLTPTDLECIESLSYRSIGDSVWKTGKVLASKNPSMNGITALTYSNDGSTQTFGPVSRNVELGRPYGDMSSSWELTEAPHLGGNEYQLSISVSNFARGEVQSAYDFNIALKAVQWKMSPALGLYDKTANTTTQFNLSEKFEYQVKVRLGIIENKIINWYNGRILDPIINLTDGILTISGRPSYYPIASTNYFTCSSLVGNKRVAITSAFGESSLAGRMCSDPGGASYVVAPQDSWAFKAFDLWDSEIKELGKNSAWAISAASNLGVCASSKLAGVVSSNALLYTVNPPTFDPISKTLSYRIASTHLGVDGQLNKGRFNLVLNKDVASCLWGINAGNLAEAKLEVTYSDGKPIVGTSSISLYNEWVYINIENFTFSSPTFKIKAYEEVKADVNVPQVPTPTSSTSPEIKKKVVKKYSITCMKGKITKKITADKPKCPAGYKKK